MLQLRPHHLRAADGTPQRRLVDDRPEEGAVGLFEHPLALHPQVDAACDLLGRDPARSRGDDRPGVLLRLQQAGHELHLVGADPGGRLLQADVGLEPRGAAGR